MFSFFKKDPAAKLNKEYLALLKQAMDAQRSGDIKTYSLLSEQAEEVRKKIDSL